MLKNEDVKIEEDEKTKNCLYIPAFNKIIISGNQNNFTRIQTIAHECLHSVQDKKIQLFNFIYSNIYLLYFATIIVLIIFKVIPNEFKMLFIGIYILLGFLYFVIRSFLENDAMINAKYLAKEYMEKNGACSKEEVEKLVDGFEQINSIGIKGTNVSLMLGVLIKVIVLAIIFIIF